MLIVSALHCNLAGPVFCSTPAREISSAALPREVHVGVTMTLAKNRTSSFLPLVSNTATSLLLLPHQPAYPFLKPTVDRRNSTNHIKELHNFYAGPHSFRG